MNNAYLSPLRNYRKLESSYEDEQKFQIMVEETDLLITIPKYVNMEEAARICVQYVSKLRQELKTYILVNPAFQHSLEPVLCKKTAPHIAKAMCQAANYAHVGPFAAVAGSIAQMTSLMLVDWITSIQSTKPINVIVENGGDIYLHSQKERIVGILSKPGEGESIGLKIYPNDSPVSICSSSSKIGHSLSFGNGDIAMVRAKNAALADALATAYCNMLKTSKDINKVIERAQKDAQIKIPHNPFNNDELMFLNFLNKHNILAHNNLDGNNFLDVNTINYNIANTPFVENNSGGLEGVFLQCDGHIGAWGKIELVAL